MKINQKISIKESTLLTSHQKNYNVLKKDKIKFIVFAMLAIILGIALYIVGKDSIIMKYVSGFCLAAWLITMFILNKKTK